ncbi:MAG TPA: transcription-repair coupling factor, partial [Porphyromonadaceae bacterium]|nr:transcription-repair coupling factor [Porphyromonadaceae bacterium]
MILKELVREYTSASVLNDVFSKLEQSESTRALLRGVSGSSRSVILSALMQKRKGFLVVVGENNEDAGYLYNDLVQINGIDKVFFFPSSYKHSVKYGQFDPSMGILRTDVLNKVFSTSEKEKEFCIIVTYPESLLEKVSTKDNLSKNTLKLNVGEEVDMSFVIDVLLFYTFERVDYVYEPGQFAVRGGIIDVFSYANEYPYRINFERNRVESIRTFEIETQLSKQNVKCVVIIPNLNKEEKEGIPFLDYLPKNTIFDFNNYNECKQRIQQISKEITNSCDT